MDLQRRIDNAIQNFTNELLSAVKSANASDLFAVLSKKPRAAAHRSAPDGRKFRRSAAELEAAAKAIAAFVVRSRNGVGAEDIKSALRIYGKRSHLNAFSRPLKIALAKKLIVKKGARRSTRYYPAGR